MVAYKKLNKAERIMITRTMSKDFYEKSEAKKLLEEIQKDYVYEMTKKVPTDIKTIAEKYPMSVNFTDFSLYTKSIIGYSSSNDSYFSWPYLIAKHCIVGFLNDKLNNKYYVETADIKNYLAVENYKLLERIENELLPELLKVNKFAQDLFCVLCKIPTLNALKNEIPEAYEAYLKNYDEPGKSKSFSCKEQNICDDIEKVRALICNK